METGLIIVGDEILSGKRRDGHLAATIERLAARGLGLAWCRIVGDDRARLARELGETMASDAVVLCCGGIGATPDDVTRQAAADAAGVALVRHPEGEAILRERFGADADDLRLRMVDFPAGATPDDVTRQAAADAAGVDLVRHPEGEAILRERFGADADDLRLRMVDFPAGAELIPNPVNRIPGFSLARHHFVPGFPRMAWPMIEWVLDTLYAGALGVPRVSHSLRVRARESDLIPLLERIGASHPAVRVSSLPETSGDDYIVELGIDGPPDAARAAHAELEAGITAAGVERVA